MRLVARHGRAALDETDPSLGLTDEQQAAVRPGREVVLEAGAGAGKTHTLALRFVASLVDVAWTETAVERVLVLTFTEKAADEMADRCRRRLAEAARAARRPVDGLDEVDLARVRANLDRMVERFEHARIATFHGFCARLLHEFPKACHTPAGSGVCDPAEVRLRLEEALEDALDAVVTDRPDALGPLLDALGSRDRLLAAGRAVIDRRSVLLDELQRRASGQDGLAERVAGAPVSADEAGRFLTTGAATLSLLVRLVAPSGGGPFVERVRDLLPTCAPDPDPLVTWSRYRDLLELPLTARGALRSLDHPTVLGRKADWRDDRRYTQAREAAKVLASRMVDWPTRARIARQLPTTADRTLFAALGPFSRWVLDAIDLFDRRLDDDRLITFDLMQQRAVDAVLAQPELRRELRRRHRHLVVDEFQDTDERQWSMVRALAREIADEPEDRVFLVGDPKQAIYGFRGGDVTVFRRAIEELGVVPSRLSINFRSRPRLVGWFDALFPSVLPGGERWEATWEPVAAGRTDEGGEVELVRVVEHDPAAVVASRLVELLAPGSELADRARYPVPPIALLLRTRSRQHRLEAELRRRRIPYVVAQGVGFWSRPEVLDLANVTAAAATDDPIAVVGFLRGPLGGLDDDAIQALGGEGLRALARGEGQGPPAAALSRLRAELRRMPFSAWLARRADERLAASTLETPEGRAEANTRRLVELSRRFDARGPEAAAEWMLGEILAEEREGELLPTPSEARVVISTVHAAKGLEFPVVVVPELDARPRGTTGAVQVGRLAGPDGERWALAFPVDDDLARVQTRVKPGLWQTLAAQSRAWQDAEERRLLYVACTRARDRLILVGRDGGEGDGASFPTWMQLVQRGLPRTTTIRAGRASDTALPAVGITGAGLVPASPTPRIPVLELQASSLDRFASCPARFWLHDLHGRPEPAPATVDRATRLAALRGRVLHDLLEEGGADVATATRRFRAAAAEEGCTADEVASGLDRVLDGMLRTLGHPEVARALSAPGTDELPFRVEHDGVVLAGRIDRLWLDGEVPVVLDWKTESRPRDHQRQLQAYAWAVQRLGRVPGPVRAQVVSTTAGTVTELGPWSTADLADVPRSLESIRALAERPFAEVEALAVASPRPCVSCGYRGAGCRGAPDQDLPT